MNVHLNELVQLAMVVVQQASCGISVAQTGFLYNGHCCSPWTWLFATWRPFTFPFRTTWFFAEIRKFTFLKPSVSRCMVVVWKAFIKSFCKLRTYFAKGILDLFCSEIPAYSVTHDTEKTFNIVWRSRPRVFSLSLLTNLSTSPLPTFNIRSNSNQSFPTETKYFRYGSARGELCVIIVEPCLFGLAYPTALIIIQTSFWVCIK